MVQPGLFHFDDKKEAPQVSDKGSASSEAQLQDKLVRESNVLPDGVVATPMRRGSKPPTSVELTDIYAETSADLQRAGGDVEAYKAGKPITNGDQVSGNAADDRYRVSLKNGDTVQDIIPNSAGKEHYVETKDGSLVETYANGSRRLYSNDGGGKGWDFDKRSVTDFSKPLPEPTEEQVAETNRELTEMYRANPPGGKNNLSGRTFSLPPASQSGELPEPTAEQIQGAKLEEQQGQQTGTVHPAAHRRTHS